MFLKVCILKNFGNVFKGLLWAKVVKKRAYLLNTIVQNTGLQNRANYSLIVSYEIIMKL